MKKIKLIYLLSMFLFITGCIIFARASFASSPVVALDGIAGYVYAKSAGGARADAAPTNAAAEFLMEDAGNGQVHFRSVYGKYLVAVGGGQGDVRASSPSAGLYETFTLMPDDGPYYRIRTHDGSFLCSGLDGDLDARITSCLTTGSSNIPGQLFTLYERDDIIDDLGFSEIHSATPIDEWTWSYVADLHLPLPTGEIVFPDAIVDITYDAVWGGVESISGTSGLPELSPMGGGLWSDSFLGSSLTATVPTVEIGYSKPRDMLNPFDLPLKNDTRYFHFLMSDSTDLQWGGFSVAAPHTGGVQIVVDHRQPTLYFYTDLSGSMGSTMNPVQSVGFGVSHGNRIPFEPTNTEGVEDYMLPFDGEVYVGGAVDVSTIDGVTLILDSDIFIDVKRAKFINNEPSIARLGYNGALTYGASLGIFSVEFDLAEGSLIYVDDSSGADYVALSGRVEPERPFSDLFPFKMKQEANFWAYFDDASGDTSYIHLDGELDFGNKFTKQEVTGSVDLTEQSGAFAGKAKFSGTSINVSGSVDEDRAQFRGSISYNWNIGAGKIKTTMEASFDTNKTEVEFDVTAKFCENFLNSCDSVSGSASVNSSGKIKVCVKIPGIGEKCDTLS